VAGKNRVPSPATGKTALVTAALAIFGLMLLVKSESAMVVSPFIKF
jgi:hypothetical protein